MEFLHEVIEIILLLMTIAGGALAYFRFRGRSFGIADLLIFGILAIGADYLSYVLFQAIKGPHADSEAYGALAVMLALFGLIPIAAGVTLIAIVALFVCLARYPAVRVGALVTVLLAGLAHQFTSKTDIMREPGGVLNNDKLAGENWALESGAISPADCDRQSSSKAFREACRAALKR